MKILRQIIDTKKIDIDELYLNVIQELISGDPVILAKKSWLCTIIVNNENMIDMRLFDSINRDTYKLGLFYSSFDSHPLHTEARVIADKICFPIHVFNNEIIVCSNNIRIVQLQI